MLEEWTGKAKSSIPDRVCSEEGFLRLVISESKRSERSGYLCRIVLVYCTNPQGIVLALGAKLGDKIFSLLSRCCRDTDYIGWYRQGHIVGVLLTTLQRNSIVDGCKTLHTRLLDQLCGAFAVTETHSLRMHVLEPGELRTFNASDHSPSPPALKNQAL